MQMKDYLCLYGQSFIDEDMFISFRFCYNLRQSAKTCSQEDVDKMIKLIWIFGDLCDISHIILLSVLGWEHLICEIKDMF